MFDNDSWCLIVVKNAQSFSSSSLRMGHILGRRWSFWCIPRSMQRSQSILECVSCFALGWSRWSKSFCSETLRASMPASGLFHLLQKSKSILLSARSRTSEACNVLIFAILSVYSFLRFKACLLCLGGLDPPRFLLQGSQGSSEEPEANGTKKAGRTWGHKIFPTRLDGSLSRRGYSEIQVVKKIYVPHESRTWGFLNHNCLEKPWGLWKGTWILA